MGEVLSSLEAIADRVLKLEEGQARTCAFSDGRIPASVELFARKIVEWADEQRDHGDTHRKGR